MTVALNLTISKALVRLMKMEALKEGKSVSVITEGLYRDFLSARGIEIKPDETPSPSESPPKPPGEPPQGRRIGFHSKQKAGVTLWIPPNKYDSASSRPMKLQKGSPKT